MTEFAEHITKALSEIFCGRLALHWPLPKSIHQLSYEFKSVRFFK